MSTRATYEEHSVDVQLIICGAIGFYKHMFSTQKVGAPGEIRTPDQLGSKPSYSIQLSYGRVVDSGLYRFLTPAKGLIGR